MLWKPRYDPSKLEFARIPNRAPFPRMPGTMVPTTDAGTARLHARTKVARQGAAAMRVEDVGKSIGEKVEAREGVGEKWPKFG